MASLETPGRFGGKKPSDSYLTHISVKYNRENQQPTKFFLMRKEIRKILVSRFSTMSKVFYNMKPLSNKYKKKKP